MWFGTRGKKFFFRSCLFANIGDIYWGNVKTFPILSLKFAQKLLFLCASSFLSLSLFPESRCIFVYIEKIFIHSNGFFSRLCTRFGSNLCARFCWFYEHWTGCFFSYIPPMAFAFINIDFICLNFSIALRSPVQFALIFFSVAVFFGFFSSVANSQHFILDIFDLFVLFCCSLSVSLCECFWFHEIVHVWESAVLVDFFDCCRSN